ALARDARVEEVYPGLEAVAEARLGARLGGIVIVDDPSPRLEAAYHRIHFTLYEAAATGRFAAMAREIDEALRDEEGLEYRVAVGDEHLFVHLREEGAELVRVIPRIALLEPAFASEGWTEWWRRWCWARPRACWSSWPSGAWTSPRSSCWAAFSSFSGTPGRARGSRAVRPVPVSPSARAPSPKSASKISGDRRWPRGSFSRRFSS